MSFQITTSANSHGATAEDRLVATFADGTYLAFRIHPDDPRSGLLVDFDHSSPGLIDLYEQFVFYTPDICDGSSRAYVRKNLQLMTYVEKLVVGKPLDAYISLDGAGYWRHLLEGQPIVLLADTKSPVSS